MADAAEETILVFLNEVAGGRRLLDAVRERVEEGGMSVAVVAPQNQPTSGQIVDADELREAAESRVEVTQQVFDGFGIEAVGAVMDADPLLALDDAIRAFRPSEVLISALRESRYGLMLRDLVETARSRYADEVAIEHIPVRIDDDAIRWDVTHTLVVATQTVSSPGLVGRLKQRAADDPHRYTFICPTSGAISRAEVCDRLASTLVEMYRAEIDATGQPMSPEPFAAVRNAIDHYRVDDVLISTFAGSRSQWLADGLVERVREYGGGNLAVEHVESGEGGGEAAAEPVGATSAQEAS